MILVFRNLMENCSTYSKTGVSNLSLIITDLSHYFPLSQNSRMTDNMHPVNVGPLQIFSHSWRSLGINTWFVAHYLTSTAKDLQTNSCLRSRIFRISPSGLLKNTDFRLGRLWLIKISFLPFVSPFSKFFYLTTLNKSVIRNIKFLSRSFPKYSKKCCKIVQKLIIEFYRKDVP